MVQIQNVPIFKISTEYDGKSRKVFPKNCMICKTEFWVPKHILKKRDYCSVKCSSYAREQRVNLICDLCGKEFNRVLYKANKPKSDLHFCSRKCKDEAQTIEIGLVHFGHYGDGSYNYRRKAFSLYGKVCKNCGYDKNEKMLDVDHIDGNRKHSKNTNLQVLCVWCHALKTRKVENHSRI